MAQTWTFNGGYAFWQLDTPAVATPVVQMSGGTPTVVAPSAPIPFVLRTGKDAATGQILWASACSDSLGAVAQASGDAVILTYPAPESRAICLPPRALAA